MGSWNGTCGISQLPIKDGEKILLFPLTRNTNKKKGGSGFCYSYGLYDVISIPLYGEYNDHGGIQNVSKNDEFVFGHFKNMIEENVFNMNDSGTPMSLEELIKVYLGEPVYEGLGYMIVLEDVYHDVMKEINSRIPYKETKTKREFFLEEGRKFLKEMVDLKKEEPLIKNRLDEIKALGKQDECFEEIMDIVKTLGVFRGNYEQFRDNEFVSYFYQFRPGLKAQRMMLKRLVDETTVQEKLLHEFVDFIMFDTAFRLLRKTWSPQSGAGSQSSEYYLHRVVATSIIKKEQELVEKWFEENVVKNDSDKAFGLNTTKEDIW